MIQTHNKPKGGDHSEDIRGPRITLRYSVLTEEAQDINHISSRSQILDINTILMQIIVNNVLYKNL
jgi:hypothetical protein